MRSKVLSCLAWGAATVLLGGALVYYNFIHKTPTPEGVEVGDICPDFTVERIVAKDGKFQMGEEVYTLSEGEGRVRIVNFWATWCGGCIHELPYFDEFAKAYPEVEIVAVCGQSGASNFAVDWMNKNQPAWTDCSLNFGFYGPDRDLYGNLGGSGMWPMTIVVDEDGVIRYTEEVELDFEKLENIVLPLLND